MTTPSKPDLVALESRIQYEIAACKNIGRAPSIQFSAAELETILRHLASHPSLYEAGLRESLEKIELATRKDGLTDRERILDIRTIVCAAISVLPADGGEESGGRAVIEGDAVVIRFPLDAMQTAMDGAWSLRAFDTRYKITDINEFAKEFRNALNREDERGTTEIHKMADRAFIDCIESGAFGIEEHEQQDL